MAINLITGKPGAGKTYLAITLLIEQYYNQVGQGLYELKDPTIMVATNIDGLRLPALQLDKYFRDNKINFENFFTAAYQDKFCSDQGKKMVYVLDECQRQIGPYFKNQEVIYYFDTHRHYDHEIWLVSQDKSKICKQISLLSEYEYRAVSRTLSLTGEMKYNVLQNGEHATKKIIRPKKEVFDLYTSAVAHTQKVKKSRALIYIPIFALLFLISGYFFYSRLYRHRDREPHAVTSTQILPVKNGRSMVSTANASESPIDRDRYAWCQVSHVARATGSLYVYDYLTSQFIAQRDYPFPIKLRGNIIWAYLPERIITAEQQRTSDRAGSQAGGRSFVGGQNDEIVSDAARYFQGLVKKAIDSTSERAYKQGYMSVNPQTRGSDGQTKKTVKASVSADSRKLYDKLEGYRKKVQSNSYGFSQLHNN